MRTIAVLLLLGATLGGCLIYPWASVTADGEGLAATLPETLAEWIPPRLTAAS